MPDEVTPKRTAGPDHERIWLQNPNDGIHPEGRMWCQDKVWPDSTEEGEPTEYIRADLLPDPEAVAGLVEAAKEWTADHFEIAVAAGFERCVCSLCAALDAVEKP